jgi:hypothetical protein
LVATALDIYNVLLKLPNGVLISDPTCSPGLAFSIVCEEFIAIYFAVFGIAVTIGLRNVKDNFNIALELRMLSLPILGRIVFFLLALAQGNFPPELHLMSGGPLTFAQILIQTVYPIWLSIKMERSQSHSLPTKPRSTVEAKKGNENKEPKTDRELLEEVLNTPELRDMFLKFLQTEFAVENLLFVMSCTELERSLSSAMDGSRTELLSKTKSIRDSFVLESASAAVNLPVGVRKPLLVALSDDKLESVDLNALKRSFTPAKEEILKLLTQDSFSRFKDTKAYLDYLSKGHVKASEVQTSPKRGAVYCCWKTGENRDSKNSQPLLVKASDLSQVEVSSRLQSK